MQPSTRHSSNTGNSKTIDNDLIALALSGDQDAYTALYNRYRVYVRRIFYQKVTEQELDDMVQDVFAQAFKKLSSFRGDAHFKTWLYRVAMNTAHMQHRIKHIDAISYDSVDPNGEGQLIKFIQVKDAGLNETLTRIYLAQLISKLSPCQKKMFIMHEIQGYQHNEMAEIMDCTIGNCKGALSRAKHKLAAKMIQLDKAQARKQSGQLHYRMEI